MEPHELAFMEDFGGVMIPKQETTRATPLHQSQIIEEEEEKHQENQPAAEHPDVQSPIEAVEEQRSSSEEDKVSKMD